MQEVVKVPEARKCDMGGSYCDAPATWYGSGEYVAFGCDAHKSRYVAGAGPSCGIFRWRRIEVVPSLPSGEVRK